MLKLLSAIGQYFLLLGKVIQNLKKASFFKLLMREINDLGVNSFWTHFIYLNICRAVIANTDV